MPEKLNESIILKEYILLLKYFLILKAAMKGKGWGVSGNQGKLYALTH